MLYLVLIGLIRFPFEQMTANNLRTTLIRINKDEHIAVLEMRSHAAWYLKGVKNSSLLKQKLFKATKIDEFEELIRNFIEGKEYEG